MKKKQLYSKGEEIFNGVTHIIGAGLGILFLIFSIVFSINKNDTIMLISLLIYGFSIILLYTMSTLYHMINKEKAKKIFRIFDHCSIFILISGTYTPYILLGIPTTSGYYILSFVWVITIIGIILNAINMHHKAVKIFSYVSYVLIGWCIIFDFNTLIQNINTISIILLFVGGIIYTIGIVFYILGKKKKWYHSIWHLFVLFGTILHFISIIYLLIQ